MKPPYLSRNPHVRAAKRLRASNVNRRRHLNLECLEDRRLLASDLCVPVLAEGEGAAAEVAVHLSAVDPQTFQPLKSVHQGEEFILLASVEDLRQEPEGVFGAYLDLLYPPDIFATAGNAQQASVVFRPDFGNGRDGVFSEGMVDELGAFSSGTRPTGGGKMGLAGIRLVATRTGEAHFFSNPADELPAHHILLFGKDQPVDSSLVNYGSLAINVLDSLPEKTVDAVPDAVTVTENSGENLFTVLENDTNITSASLTITAVDATSSRGSVSISNGGSLLVYTPEKDFVGTDQFTYTATADGRSDTTTVTVDVQRVTSREDVVSFDLQIKDLDGNPVQSVTVGEEFVLHVSAEDLRTSPAGVFAAYMDIRYTSEAASPSGAIIYGADYENGRLGSTTTIGEIDEVGAFSATEPLGGGQFEVFKIPFLASAPGRVVLESNPAEDIPTSDTLVYDVDEVVAIDDISYGRAAVTVVPAVVAVDDTYNVPLNGTVQTFSVLENDINLGGGDLTVTSVDTSGVLGVVEIVDGGLGLTYTPPSGFGGSEQFMYTASGPVGSSTAEVTIHVTPDSALNDQVSIRLETTDLDGNPISAIPAGQEFLVRTVIEDLRGEGANRGVYATYFDLLYERDGVHPALAPDQAFGIAVGFGADYQNGRRGDASVPGIINEFGAFQTSTTPLGSGDFTLLSARFQAAAVNGVADAYQILEDQSATLSVLENDVPVSGETTFRADPADNLPNSDVLLYDPVDPVPYKNVRYGQATIEITAGGAGAITSIGDGSAGGSITIADGGNSLLYSPLANFNGIETFTYSVAGGSDVEVSVSVVAVNDAPTASGDKYRVREGQLLTVAADSGVSANDVDVDGDLLNVMIVGDTSHGTLQLESDGSFTYEPVAGFLGTDAFTYKVSDGTVESAESTVTIEVVPRPVSIRLEAVDSNGLPVTEVVADEPLAIRALVQDLRSSNEANLGIGAAYVDVVYNVDDLSPVTDTGRPLGIDIRFGSDYQNGISGELLAEGKINDVGALQTGLGPLGDEELNLFTAFFDLGGPRAVDDSYLVSAGAQATRLDVLANEAELQWQVEVDAQHADNSPFADVVYLDPAEPVSEDDITYGGASVTVTNGDLVIQSLGEAQSGAALSIDHAGRILYVPAAGFSGADSFTYTLVDGKGRTAEATAKVEVVESWHNAVEPTDVNGDSFTSPADALIIINKLNAFGAHVLVGKVDAFLDANGDGQVSPIDVLIVINRLISGVTVGEGESVAPEPHYVAPLSSGPWVSLDTSENGLASRRSNSVSAPEPIVSARSIEDVQGWTQDSASLVVDDRFTRDTDENADFEQLLDFLANDIASL